jgi:hypothetical protein
LYPPKGLALASRALPLSQRGRFVQPTSTRRALLRPSCGRWRGARVSSGPAGRDACPAQERLAPAARPVNLPGVDLRSTDKGFQLLAEDYARAGAGPRITPHNREQPVPVLLPMGRLRWRGRSGRPSRPYFTTSRLRSLCDRPPPGPATARELGCLPRAQRPASRRLLRGRLTVEQKDVHGKAVAYPEHGRCLSGLQRGYF